MTDLEKIATDCRSLAHYYNAYPWNIDRAVVDQIFHYIALLAEAAEKRAKEPLVKMTDDAKEGK